LDYTRQNCRCAADEEFPFQENGWRKARKDDPTRFDEEIDGRNVTLNYIGAGHIMGSYRMGPNKDVNSDQRS